MALKSIFSSLVREVDGTWSTAYSTFNLKSALQPIFRRTASGMLDIDSFEGLVRPHRNGEPVTPGEFFSLVAPEDIENIDSILRTIHIPAPASSSISIRGCSRLRPRCARKWSACVLPPTKPA